MTGDLSLAIDIPLFTSSEEIKSTDVSNSNKLTEAVPDAVVSSSSNTLDMDFDLLAEFFLDEGEDTSSNWNTQSGIVSIEPEDVVSSRSSPPLDPLVDDMAADPLADAHAAALSGDSDKDGEVSELAKDLQVIQSMFASNKEPASYSKVKPQIASSGVIKSAHNNSIKRKISEVDSFIPSLVGSLSDNLDCTADLEENNNDNSNDDNVPKVKSQAQIDRRRERNRILARRTRLRKKFFFESLQKDVTELHRENTVLKNIIRGKLPGMAAEILEKCKPREEIPSVVQELNHDLEKQDFNLVQSLQVAQKCFIITDPSLQDNPIVFASPSFLELTGYKRDEVLGRNCRFLQGKDTSPQKVELLKKAVKLGQDVNVVLVNYTSAGLPFWNNVFIAPLRDANHHIVNFIGVLSRIAGPPPEDPEHGRDLDMTKPVLNNSSEKQDDSDIPTSAAFLNDDTTTENDVDSMVQIALDAAEAVAALPR